MLTVTFTHPHTTDGIVIRGCQHSDDYPGSITVAYYDIDNVLIRSDAYSPDAWEYAIVQDVVGFAKIVVTFHATSKPLRHLRLEGIDYGQLITFSNAQIKGAELVEEIDPVSTRIPHNTCDLTVYSEAAAFSMVNPTGYYARLDKRQPMSFYETVDGARRFVARQFLDDWKSRSENLSDFKCMDAIGLMGGIPFRGGLWLPDGILSQNLVELIMNVSQMPYELDADLYDIPVMGWIPESSCRDALRQVAIAIGAYPTCCRSGLVKVIPSLVLDGTESYAALTKSMQGMRPPLDMKKLVTAVEITGHDYAPGSEVVTAWNGAAVAGRQSISFRQPLHSLEVTGAEIAESGANYAVIHVQVAGTVVLTGLSYIDNTQTFRMENPFLGSWVIPNVAKVTAGTLINSSNGIEVAERLYVYLQQRHMQKALKLFAPSIAPGQVALSDTQGGKRLLGVVEKMTTDLTGGFVAKADIVGVVAD